jgi:ornithine cyclodeaminase/alanine dehydrogenase-like protein (mu-crystallin family)
MRVVGPEEIRRAIGLPESIEAMREAVIAQSRGECDTPMPMHLDLSAGGGGEVHIKSSYRRGGRHIALKMAGSFVDRPYGTILLVSVVTGETLAYFDDGGHLTDLRTAAVAAMVARELGRADTSLGILGTGVQARLQARLHAEVLRLDRVTVWGRNPGNLAAFVRELGVSLGVRTVAAESPAEVAQAATLIVTATASRQPLLRAFEIRPGTHISAVGADTPGKQELDPEILRKAALLLVDSLAQCRKLGELQHAPSEAARAVEIGAFCVSPTAFNRGGITVADFTGLGAEDLFIAEACHARLAPKP